MKKLAVVFVLAIMAIGCGKDDKGGSNGRYTRAGFLTMNPGSYGYTNPNQYYANNSYQNQWGIDFGFCVGNPMYCNQQQGYRQPSSGGIFLRGSDGRIYQIQPAQNYNSYNHNSPHQNHGNQNMQVMNKIQAFTYCSQGRDISAQVHSNQPINGNIIYATRIDSSQLDNCMRNNGMNNYSNNGHTQPNYLYPSW